MRHGMAAFVLAALFAAPAHAQIIVVPQPVPVFVPANGIGFHYSSKNLKIKGFIGGGYGYYAPGYYPSPYGIVENRVIVQVVNPPVLVTPATIFPRYQYDLSGIDLDVEGPERLNPNGQAKAPPKKLPEPIKVPKEKVPAKKVEEPKKPEPPPVKPPPVKPGPFKEPALESQRLFDLGLEAFGNQEYGLAAFRFRQATEVEPVAGRPHFYLAQAYVALGKFTEAVRSIEEGMKRKADWPLAGFQPRVDLYKGIEADWFAHKKQIEDAQARHPEQTDYLFLKAYQWWFDGQKQDATVMFRNLRGMVAETRYIDAFLKWAPALAAK